MMPVPSHLRECVRRPDEPIDSEPLVAPVACPCGGDIFELLYPGENREDGGELFPVVAEIAGNFFLLVKARCMACRREHILLDIDFHGWNGYVAHNSEQASLPRPPLVPWKCLSCNDSRHRMTVTICTEGPVDFAEETNGTFDPATWPDAFGWFSLDTKCDRCWAED